MLVHSPARVSEEQRAERLHPEDLQAAGQSPGELRQHAQTRVRW